MGHTYINNITNKANSTLAVLKRNVRVPSKTIKAAPYKALVRPHVEYCSAVWDPQQISSQTSLKWRKEDQPGGYVTATGQDSTGPTEMMTGLN